jgi:hypothetical protein
MWRGAFKPNTPIRRLEGITYWVIEEPNAIYDFINTNIRREWEADARGDGRDPNTDPLLQSLSKYRWRLEIVDTEQVRPDTAIMGYVNEKTGYNFAESLTKRGETLQTTIEKGGSVVWPLILRKAGYLLLDGYCRFTVLRKMMVPKVYAYVGEKF